MATGLDSNQITVEGVTLAIQQNPRSQNQEFIDSEELGLLAKKVGLTCGQILLFLIPVFGWAAFLIGGCTGFNDSLRYENAQKKVVEHLGPKKSWINGEIVSLNKRVQRATNVTIGSHRSAGIADPSDTAANQPTKDSTAPPASANTSSGETLTATSLVPGSKTKKTKKPTDKTPLLQQPAAPSSDSSVAQWRQVGTNPTGNGNSASAAATLLAPDSNLRPPVNGKGGSQSAPPIPTATPATADARSASAPPRQMGKGEQMASGSTGFAAQHSLVEALKSRNSTPGTKSESAEIVYNQASIDRLQRELGVTGLRIGEVVTPDGHDNKMKVNVWYTRGPTPCARRVLASEVRSMIETASSSTESFAPFIAGWKRVLKIV